MPVIAKPLLYSYRRCPYAMRARMALWCAGIQVDLLEISLRDKPAAMLKVSPKGTVPVLHCADGLVLEESLAIMRWALGQHDPQGWLLQADQPEQRNGAPQRYAGCYPIKIQCISNRIDPQP